MEIYAIEQEMLEKGLLGPFDPPNRKFLDEGWRALYERACEIRERARSYRGFKVGAAILVAYKDAPHELKVFLGANLKLEEKGSKRCAERMAMNAAVQMRHGKLRKHVGHQVVIVEGIVVVAEPQTEDHLAGLELSTLHPCKECRMNMRFHAAPQIEVPLETRIVTATPPPGNAYTIQTFDQLLRFHSEGQLRYADLFRK